MDNYSLLINRIASAAHLSLEDIERLVEAKRAKLSGFITKEGAAQIVAAEKGINLDQEQLKLSELMDNMKRVNVKGKILDIYPVRSFSKQGREGKIGSFLFADESAAARVVLWDTSHIDLIESGKIKKGDVFGISNGSFRNGEIHLSSFSDLKKINERMENVVEVIAYKNVAISDIRVGGQMKTRAFIVQAFEPRYFEVCSKCGKKVVEGKCNEHGIVEPKKRALLSVVIDDGSENLRVVLFGEQILKLGLSDEEIFSLEAFNAKKNEIIGEEMVFSGKVRMNELFSNNELIVDNVEKVDVSELIKELESKA